MALQVLPLLISALAGAGIYDLVVKREANATTLSTQDGQVISTIDNALLQGIEQNTQEKPYTIAKAYIKRTLTTATSRPSTPDQKITVSGMKVLNISLIFDTNFKLAGKFDLLVNNSVFLSVDASDLTDTDQFSLDFQVKGWAIPDFQTVELYAYTSNGSSCAVTLSLTLGV